MQSQKKLKKWPTKRKGVSTGLVLFPEVVHDYNVTYNVIARKSHTGYLHLLFVHFKQSKYMDPQFVKLNETQITAPGQKVFPNELWEYLLYDVVVKTTIVASIEGKGILDAIQNIYAIIPATAYVVSISLAPLNDVKNG